MKFPPLEPSKKKIDWKSTAAETLAEVLMALTVLAVGSAGALTLVSQSVRANSEAEERIVAYNLAREGVETVRNIRDTNWLRFPGDRENCWDVMPDTIDPTVCPTTATHITSNDYIVYPEISDTDKLFAWNITTTSDYEMKGTLIDGQIFVTHEIAPGDPEVDTGYDRVITIVNDGAGTMEVTSTVTWTSRTGDHIVKFADELTNY
jgi:type II secretory pathway pseudopilin PulG